MAAGGGVLGSWTEAAPRVLGAAAFAGGVWALARRGAALWSGVVASFLFGAVFFGGPHLWRPTLAVSAPSEEMRAGLAEGLGGSFRVTADGAPEEPDATLVVDDATLATGVYRLDEKVALAGEKRLAVSRVVREVMETQVLRASGGVAWRDVPAPTDIPGWGWAMGLAGISVVFGMVGSGSAADPTMRRARELAIVAVGPRAWVLGRAVATAVAAGAVAGATAVTTVVLSFLVVKVMGLAFPGSGATVAAIFLVWTGSAAVWGAVCSVVEECGPGWTPRWSAPVVSVLLMPAMLAACLWVGAEFTAGGVFHLLAFVPAVGLPSCVMGAATVREPAWTVGLALWQLVSVTTVVGVAARRATVAGLVGEPATEGEA